TFEVSSMSEEKIQLEAQLFATQLLFQYLFSQGRLQDARTYILNQDEAIQAHRVIRNLLAMCYLYLSEYDIAKDMFEALLSEDNSDVHALCHYTLLLYNTNEKDKYHKYLKILSKVMPMNDDESFKLGIVLSYLKQYEASQQILLPLYKKGKFASIQMFNALSFNYYYLGNKEQSQFFWDKLLQISKVDVGYAPWVLEESKQAFDQKILPLLLDDDSHYRLYGVFLLNQLNGKEILMTQEIWSILEKMNDYEKLYLTYLVQGLHLNKLDFIHKGLVRLYEMDEIHKDTELFISWIDKGEGLIANEVDLSEVDRYVAAHAY
uniref:tetratricopeptide repeat protein n=1 Tax=Staphylococcus haemolyticus TaxID=1283 RepID=UPI0015D8DB00